ncbi:MAG: shikimate kinase [Acidobacteria bacterium]|nr:shikimate kinase [Acidobacteriota bacterium]
MILKLKRTPGLYLVGFMASGKSTIGKQLADTLGWDFVDLDNDIEAREQTRISVIFDTRGEAEFRRIEHETLLARVRNIESGHPTVIALGGGAFVQERNRELLHNNGITIWLDTPFASIEQRVRENQDRPLARDPKAFRELFDMRREQYTKAHLHIAIDSNDPLVAVREILDNLKLA